METASSIVCVIGLSVFCYALWCAWAPLGFLAAGLILMQIGTKLDK